MAHSYILLTIIAADTPSTWDLVSASGPFVKLILLGLVGMSVFTWTIVGFKRKILISAEEENRDFEAHFDSAPTLEEAHRAARSSHRDVAAARILVAGYQEATKERPHASEAAAQSRRVDRVLRSAVALEGRRLERRLPFLAITGSTAPFIGLFGTVWGIMRSFQDIGALRSVDLSVVAPGISEALIATAAGLFAAIPAVMAYNTFLNRIRGIKMDLEAYADRVLNRIEREWPQGEG